MQYCVQEGNGLGLWWPSFTNYSPPAQPWKDLISPTNPDRLLRYSAHSASIGSVGERSLLEDLDRSVPELLMLIIKRLIETETGYPEFFRLAQTCRQFSKMSRDPMMWKELCLSSWARAGLHKNRHELRR